jgi:hypothetical protein
MYTALADGKEFIGVNDNDEAGWTVNIESDELIFSIRIEVCVPRAHGTTNVRADGYKLRMPQECTLWSKG